MSKGRPEFVRVSGGWWDWPWYRKVAAWLRYAPRHNVAAAWLVARQWVALKIGRRPPWAWVVVGTQERLRPDEWHGEARDGCLDASMEGRPHGLSYERSLDVIWSVARQWDSKVGRVYHLERPTEDEP